MGFKALAVAQSILYLIRDAKKKDLVKEIAQKVEEISDKNLAGYSERVQLTAIQDVLLPLCVELVQDDPKSKQRLKEILAQLLLHLEAEETAKG